MGESQDINLGLPEEKDAQKQLSALQDIAHQGALFADWKNSYCTQKFIQWLDAQIMDTKNSWLTMKSREEAEAVRLQAQSYVKVKNWINAKILAGDLAAKGMKELYDQGVQLEGLVKLPPTQE